VVMLPMDNYVESDVIFIVIVGSYFCMSCSSLKYACFVLFKPLGHKIDPDFAPKNWVREYQQ